jgi:hypothetical protein
MLYGVAEDRRSVKGVPAPVKADLAGDRAVSDHEGPDGAANIVLERRIQAVMRL